MSKNDKINKKEKKNGEIPTYSCETLLKYLENDNMWITISELSRRPQYSLVKCLVDSKNDVRKNLSRY